MATFQTDFLVTNDGCICLAAGERLVGGKMVAFEESVETEQQDQR
jgi:hypothetical protein